MMEPQSVPDSEVSPESSSSTAPPPAAARVSSRLLSGSLYTLGSLVGGQILTILISVVYARLLGLENLGVLAIYVHLSGLLVVAAALAINVPVARFVAAMRPEPERLERMLSTVLWLTMAWSVPLSVLGFVAAETVGVAVYGSPDLVLMIRIMVPFLILNALSTVGAAILQGLQAIRTLSFLGIAVKAVTVPFIWLALVAFGLPGAAIGGVLVLFIATALYFGMARRHLRREGIRLRPRLDRPSFRSLMAFTLPLLASAVLLRIAFLFQSSYVALNLGYADAGLIKIALSLYNVMLFLPGAISVPLLPVFSELHASGGQAKVKRDLTTMLRIATYAGVPLALGIGFAAGPLIALLFGTDYLAAAPLVFVLVMAGYVEIVGVMAGNSLLGEGRTSLLLRLDLLQVSVLVLSTTVFVGWFGVLGVAYAMLLNSIVYGIAIFVVLARGRDVDPRPAGAALLLALGGFSLGTLGMLVGSAQSAWVGVPVILAYVGGSWAIMTRRERTLIAGLLAGLLRRAPVAK